MLLASGQGHRCDIGELLNAEFQRGRREDGGGSMAADLKAASAARQSRFAPSRFCEAQFRNRARQQRLQGAQALKSDEELIAEAIAAGRVTRCRAGQSE